MSIHTHLEISRDSNDGSRLERQTCAVRKRVPVPELSEQGHTDNRTHALASSATLQTNGDISATSIDEALGESSTESSHWIFVLV